MNWVRIVESISYEEAVNIDDDNFIIISEKKLSNKMSIIKNKLDSECDITNFKRIYKVIKESLL